MTSDMNRPTKIIRVAVDAMGGDYAPSEVVKGAVRAAKREKNVELILVGDREAVEEELKRYSSQGLSISVVSSEGKIGDDEHPAQALRQKPNASIVVTTRLVKEGRADALVSMGSTGAAMASATILLGLMEGLERPCLGGPFLGLAPKTVVVDLGSNVDSRPTQLLDFALLGCVFARHFLEIENPRVGLLSVGAEDAKGNRQVRESQQLFKGSGLNFIGNVEGMDFFTQRADVIVCDGFVGNILLKFAEGLGASFAGYLKQALKGRLSPGELENLVTQVWDMTNIAKKMGGPLFGVNGHVVIGHGASREDAVAGAIDTARRCVEVKLVENTKKELALMRARMRSWEVRGKG